MGATMTGADTRAFAATIESFFSRGVSVGLHLPSGWFGGRPMENQHNVTLAIGRPARLILELDERVLLTFTGEDLSVERVQTRLLHRGGTLAIRICGFQQLVMDQRLYGSSRVKVVVFTEGDVELVSAR